MIFEKVYSLPLDEMKDSEAVTLISTDVDRIIWGMPAMHELWAIALQAIIAAWLLYRQLGLSFVPPIVVSVGKCAVQMHGQSMRDTLREEHVSKANHTKVSAVIALGFSVLAGKRQKLWLEAIQERLSESLWRWHGFQGSHRVTTY